MPAQSTFSYVTYIRTSPEKLWSALTNAEHIKQYWFGVQCTSQWTAGSSWKLMYPDGRNTDAGEIVEAVPRRRLVIRWQHQDKPELRAEGESRCTMELESAGPAVKLSITHTIEREPSHFIAAVSRAWPMVISNLKSLLETSSIVLQSPNPRERPFQEGVAMAKITFGNHSSVLVPRQDRDNIRKFFCDVLGGKIMKADPERDFVRLGEDFYIGFLYGDVTDESEFLRSARAIWLEIKSDNVEELSRKIVESGLVRKLDIPDPHLYFQAPGGQCLRLVGIDEDLSFYEGKGEGPNVGKVKEALRRMEHEPQARD